MTLEQLDYDRVRDEVYDDQRSRDEIVLVEVGALCCECGDPICQFSMSPGHKQFCTDCQYIIANDTEELFNGEGASPTALRLH